MSTEILILKKPLCVVAISCQQKLISCGRYLTDFLGENFLFSVKTQKQLDAEVTKRMPKLLKECSTSWLTHTFVSPSGDVLLTNTYVYMCIVQEASIDWDSFKSGVPKIILLS